jgi:hypothetical protein
MRGGNHHLLAVILTLGGFTGQSQFRLEHMSYIRQTKILLKHQQKIRKQRRKQTFDHGVTRHLQRHQACIRRGQFRCALLATFQRGKLPFRRRGIKQIHHVRGRVAGFIFLGGGRGRLYRATFLRKGWVGGSQGSRSFFLPTLRPEDRAPVPVATNFLEGFSGFFSCTSCSDVLSPVRDKALLCLFTPPPSLVWAV